jgi:hypothetical protein
VSDSLAAFSFTVKLGGDLFTIRGNTPEEFMAHVQSVVLDPDVIATAQALQEHAVAASKDYNPVAAAKAGLGATHVATIDTPAKAAPAGPAPWDTPADPFGSSTTAPAPACEHGPRLWKEGTSKQGKPWKGWFCPNRDRNNQCKPQWA